MAKQIIFHPFIENKAEGTKLIFHNLLARYSAQPYLFYSIILSSAVQVDDLYHVENCRGMEDVVSA